MIDGKIDLDRTIFDKYDGKADIIYYCGDALEFCRKIPDSSVRLVITSPPYNLNKPYERDTGKNIEEYLEEHKPLISELKRILTDDGSVCWEVGNYVKNGEVFPLDIFYYPIFKEVGFYLRNRIVWRFGHGLHARYRFSGRYEVILWFTKASDKKKYLFNLDAVRVPPKYPGKRYYKGKKKGQPSCNPLGKNPGDVWEIVKNDWEREIWEIPNVKANHCEKTVHPCQFPVELAERLVLALSNPKDWVYDPYAGVGSTLIAAIKHGRRAMGSEKEEIYVNIGKKRIADFFEGKLKLRPLGRKIYTPKPTDKVASIPEEWKKDKRIGWSGNFRWR